MKKSSSEEEDSQYFVSFGKESIPISVAYSSRRTLKIEVQPSRQVVVRAPAGTPVDEVVSRAQRRAAWIAKQRTYFERFLPAQPPRKYVGGETHLFLGRQVRLKLVDANEESVKLHGKYLVVHLRPPRDKARVRTLVEGWFKHHGKLVIDRRLAKCYGSVQGSGIPHPQVRFLKMTKRWGSCSRRGTIVINTELSKASVPCIDYVLFHELCHLKHPNHSRAFYKLLSRFVPEWRRWKERLELVNL